MTIDTLKVAKRLREAGFTEPQAEAVVAACRKGTAGADLATKADLAEPRETELRLEAKIEAVRSDISGVKADILNRVFGMILGDTGRQHRRHRRSHVRGREAGRPLRTGRWRLCRRSQ
jgi:hypothetical protein